MQSRGSGELKLKLFQVILLKSLKLTDDKILMKKKIGQLASKVAEHTVGFSFKKIILIKKIIFLIRLNFFLQSYRLNKYIRQKIMTIYPND